MKASLRALLNGAIDYAGLFPPAELPLEEAIRNYARYRRDHQAWMLGRFICPAGRLNELTPYMDELFQDEPMLRISALGRGGNSAEEFVIGFGRDMQAMVEFEAEFSNKVRIDVLETRLPPLGHVAFEFDADRIALFLECTPGSDWRASILSAIAFAAGTGHRCGFKFRTGGVEPSAFPLSERIAFTIAACRDQDIALKFTAGLHHPIRHFNPGMNSKMHGFINVFVAGVMAEALKLDEGALLEILDDEYSESFRFDDELIAWKDHRVATQQVQTARRERIISFGSCSFDEPRDDLRALGWL